MLKSLILTTLGLVFYDWIFGIFVVGFWIGFLGTAGYLYYIFIHNPEAAQGWFMTDWSTIWLYLSPFIFGTLSGWILQAIPYFILEKEL